VLQGHLKLDARKPLEMVIYKLIIWNLKNSNHSQLIQLSTIISVFFFSQELVEMKRGFVAACSNFYAVSAEILEVADADIILHLDSQCNFGFLLKYFVLFVFFCIVYNLNYLIFWFSM
jgi:hypothetical protein